MRKRNAKTLGISLALMLVMCVATTLLSFSLADPSTGTGDTTGTDTSAALSTTRTNIDYIIDNSANGGTDESGRDLTPFYIVEVGSASSSANSPLAAMVAEDKLGDSSDTDISQFVKQVINGWSTENKTMVPNKISYQYISVGSLGDDAALTSAITSVSKADLVYVSNDPNSKYSASKDIPEDLKLILAGVATTNYTPFIIDSPTKTEQGDDGGGSSSKTYTQLANKILATAGYYRNAFSYNTTAQSNVTNYLNRLDSTSLWLPIYGGKHSANWYVDDTGSTTARVLTIQSGATDNAVTTKLLGALDTTATYDLTNIVDAKADDGVTAKYPDFVATGKTAYTIKDTTTMYTYGYSTSQDRPDNLVFETMAPADITATTDLSVYDLIILEKGVASTTMSDDMYNMFSSLVYGLQHILYDSTMNTSGQGENPINIVTSSAVNYQFVVNKVADANEKSRFTNVLVTSMREMKIYGAATAPSGVKAIADIINNGSYRGSGGDGSSSNLYTVLEIQPCYPIDLNLAKALQDRGMRSFAEKGRDSGNLPENDRRDIFYYLRHDSVLNKVTSDEITFDGGKTSLSDMESTDSATTGISARGAISNNDAALITTDNATDYYAWELSKAKIAHLTGLPYNKVQVVHMSTVEFNTSRDTLLDNYDAIYIGGKNTAIKDIQYIPTDGRGNNAAVYNMYFHNGGTYSYNGAIEVLTGNDITYDKFVELQKYVTAGMPLIFTKAVSDAYYGAKAQGYNQTLMDPESNVYKLMDLYMSTDAAEQSTNGDYVYPTEKVNVLAGFDSTDQVKVPNNGDYGTTYGGYVTVFGGTATEVYVNDGTGNKLTTLTSPNTESVNAEELSALLTSTQIGSRPKFALLQAPATYVEGDVKTEITTNSITFKFDIAPGAAYTINVYADDNTNSRFEDTEKLNLKQNGNTVTATFSNSFDGALYWKFEIVSGNCKSSVTGLSKVKVKTKNYVNVLQIISDYGNERISINSKTTLLFCTECQEARGILYGNRRQSNGKYTESAAFNETFGDADYNDNFTVQLPDPSAVDTGYTNVAKGKNLGIHRHNFGIVKYDSHYTLGQYTGLDNWETNWAEDLYNDYDMDIDIWTTRDFEKAVDEATKKVTADNAATVLEDYKSLASIYQSYYLTMQSIINGEGKPDSANYKYLKNKLTRTDTAFAEADLNALFGEEKSAYDLETAKGGFSISSEEFDHYATAQSNIDTLLNNAKAHKLYSDKTTVTQMAQEIVYETKYHRYSDFFSLYNASSQLKYDDRTAIGSLYDDFKLQYQYWRNAKIFEQYFYKMYLKYLTFSTMKEYNGKYLPDYTEVYSCIVVGVAENFGDDDIKTMDAINTLKAYIANEGNTFIFHQTINDGGNTPMMTNNLKTDFGQNYSHITTRTVTETALTYSIRTANSWEKASAGVVASGKIEVGQGIDVEITCSTSEGQLLPSDVKVTPNSTGAINIKYTNSGGGNWSNQRVWIFVNDTVEKYEYNPASNTANSGTLTNVATINETAVESTRVINEASSDTDRYHYTAMLKNGNSIAVSPKHLAMVNPGVWGNAEKFGRFMYTQTAILNSDVQIPNTHKAFVSGGTNYGAFTDRATQTNKGVVTLYPFLIASELKISATHPNSFSTDIEDKDMVVYYALAGGSEGSRSSVAAADPQDGIDNYFIYTYGNVTYCGAGHTNITGIHRDNNDERRLFINIILNSVKKSVFGPTIDVFDPYPEKNADGSTKLDDEGQPIYTNNTITRAEDGSYEMVVPNADTIPEFTYRVTVPDVKDEVASVMIYYDLSPNASSGDYGFVNGTDVLIFQADAKDDASILKDKYKLIDKSIDALKLKPNYFQPYENKYTYIVIAVKTTKGIVATQRIMIKIAPKLWDLT